MADYHKSKRKRVRDIKSHISVQKDNIIMTADGEKEKFRVIKNRKSVRKRNRLICSAVALCVVILLLIINFITPTGIFESAEVLFSTIKIAKTNDEINGTKVIDTYNQKNSFFVLSDTSLQSFTNSGKVINTFFHGYSSPLMASSSIRCLVFDQGKTNISVYNAAKHIFSIDTEKEIYTAAVSKNGTFAVSTKSESYASQITVYSKKGTQIYSWYNPNEIINSIAVSNNGKYLAFSAVKSDNGDIVSNVYVLKVGAASYDYSYTYDGYVYSIETLNSTAFTVTTESGIDIIKFKKPLKVSFETDTFVQKSLNCRGKSYVLSALNSESSESVIDIINVKGVNKLHKKLNVGINDYTVMGSNIYLLSENKVFVLNSKGEIIKAAECEYGFKKVVPVNGTLCYLVSDNATQKIVLKKVEQK